MAKKRKLTAPTAEDLGRIEAEFRSETRNPGARSMAPIAQIAAESAQVSDVVGPETRARLAEAEKAAENLRHSETKGLILKEIPLDQIKEDELFRDRMTMSREELDELRDSIVTNGMRMPIEVFELPEPDGIRIYGLISGYRRLMVMREAYSFTELEKYATIKAIVRKPQSSAAAFAAIAEENEVRAQLTHYERGRFAALCAGNGIFGSVEEAVENLFPFASKSKKSKVRSFALIFEELGDMLKFPEDLSERQGLRVAAILRGGAEDDVREAFVGKKCANAREEWQIIEEIVEIYEEQARDEKKMGRPTNRSRLPKDRKFTTSAGIRVEWDHGQHGGYVVKLNGKGLHADIMDSLMAEIRSWLGSR